MGVDPELDVPGTLRCGPYKLFNKDMRRPWNLVLNHQKCGLNIMNIE